MVSMEKKEFFVELTYVLGWSVNDAKDLLENTTFIGVLFTESQLSEMECKKNALDTIFKFFEKENPYFIAIRDDGLYEFATEKDLEEYDYLSRYEEVDKEKLAKDFLGVDSGEVYDDFMTAMSDD